MVGLTACGSTSAASDASSTGTRPGPPRAAGCGPRDAETLAASRWARVYVFHRGVYGCAIGHGGSYRLGAAMRSIREGRVGPVAVAGWDAAYGLSAFGVDTVSAQVIVHDLRSGRRLRALAASTKVLPESLEAVQSIVVKPDGAVAWISQTMSVIGRASAALEVHRADVRGTSLLDSGRSILARSLRLRGSRLTWRDGPTTRAATLQ